MTKRNLKSVGDNQVVAHAMVFENPEFGMIRTLTDDKGEPLFCGKDVCEALGYKQPVKAVSQHVSKVDVAKRHISTQIISQGKPTGKTKLMQMLFINESGFYALVFGSKLEAAKRFTHWVTSEVLPQIRKNGCYVLRQEIQQKDEIIGKQTLAIAMKEKLIGEQTVEINMKKKLIGEQTQEIRRLNGVVDDQVVSLSKQGENIIALESDVDRLLPKALYSDKVLESVSCYTTTQVAKELGCTAQELNRSLCACRVQYYQSGQYMLYAEYAHMGLAKSRTHYQMSALGGKGGMLTGMEGIIQTRTYLVWTEKGRKFIHDLAHRLWALAEKTL